MLVTMFMAHAAAADAPPTRPTPMPTRKVTAAVVGIGAGVVLGGLPLLIARDNSNAGTFVLSGVGLYAGSTLGVHLVRKGSLGAEALGGLGGMVVGGLWAAGFGSAGVSTLFSGGIDVGRILVGIGAAGLVVTPSLGAVLGAELGDRAPRVSIAPALLPGRDHTPGMSLSMTW